MLMLAYCMRTTIKGKKVGKGKRFIGACGCKGGRRRSDLN